MERTRNKQNGINISVQRKFQTHNTLIPLEHKHFVSKPFLLFLMEPSSLAVCKEWWNINLIEPKYTHKTPFALCLLVGLCSMFSIGYAHKMSIRNAKCVYITTVACLTVLKMNENTIWFLRISDVFLSLGTRCWNNNELYFNGQSLTIYFINRIGQCNHLILMSTNYYLCGYCKTPP